MKRIFAFFLAGILLLASGCLKKPDTLNKICADDISIYYSVSSHALFGADQDVIDTLTNMFDELSFVETSDEIDVLTMFSIFFSSNGKTIKNIYVDKNGVFMFGDEGTHYRVDSGSWNYDYIMKVYLNDTAEQGD